MQRDPKYRRLAAANAVVGEQPIPDIDTGTDDGREIETNLPLIDADLAGIAHTLLNNHELPDEHKAILQRDVLSGSRLQLCLLKPDGSGPTEIDVSHLPDVLEYARNLEELRKACFEIVFGTRH